MTLGATPYESEFNGQFLHIAGFTDREIEAFDLARDPQGNFQPPINLSDETWRNIVEERQQWLETLQYNYQESTGKRLTRQQVDRIIDSFYDRDPNFTPWDWLKKEYQKSKPNGQSIDHVEAARQRALVNTAGMRGFVKR